MQAAEQSQYVGRVVHRMQYLQDQLDTHLPRAITHLSNKLEQKHLREDMRTVILDRLQHLLDEEISYREEIIHGAYTISIVEDIHSAAAQTKIREDSERLQKLSEHFYSTADKDKPTGV